MPDIEKNDGFSTSARRASLSKAAAPPPVVVMGVCGCGKTTIGTLIGQAIDAQFIDGDTLHPQANVDKMAAGSPLNDDDRRPWLQKVGETLAQSTSGRIIACSALKRRYRQQIVAAAGRPVLFLLLAGSRAILSDRMKSRKGHFMPPALLDSQLDTLELPDEDEFAVVIDGDQPVQTVFEAALKSITALSNDDTASVSNQ